MDSKESETKPSVTWWTQGPLVIMENVKFPTYGRGQLRGTFTFGLGPNVERQGCDPSRILIDWILLPHPGCNRQHRGV